MLPDQELGRFVPAAAANPLPLCVAFAMATLYTVLSRDSHATREEILRQLYPDEFFRLEIIQPPHDEQLKIVESIQVETADLDTAISRLNREIDLLREYRTRLVADVVTGKLDVREAAARLPNEDLLPDLAAADDEPDDLPIEEEDDA
jgi:hypothetical protein